MARLHQSVGGEELKQTFLRELDMSLDVATKGRRAHVFYPEEPVEEMKRAEEIGIFTLGRGSVLFPALGYAYSITGDRKYLDIGMKVLAFCLLNQRGGSDASATSFITAFLREAKLAGLGAKEEAVAFAACREYASSKHPPELVNGDLEQGSFVHWDIKKVPGQRFFYDDLVKVGWYLDDQERHEGRYSLRFHSDNFSRQMSASIKVALGPERRWRVSVWVKADEGMNPGASFVAKEYDTDRSRSFVLRATGRTQDGWEERAGQLVTGVRAVGILGLSQGNGTGDCWFDSARAEDLGPAYKLLTENGLAHERTGVGERLVVRTGGAYWGEPKIGGGDEQDEQPIPFSRGSLTDGVARYNYLNVPRATYSYWKLPEARLTFDLGKAYRIREVRFMSNQNESHGTALVELVDPASGQAVGRVEPPANGWNSLTDLDLVTREVVLHLVREEGDSYITLAEVEIWGEPIP
jgi:hypothetical protein